MKRKYRIAVLAEQVFSDEAYEILCGVFAGAKDLNLDVLVFACGNADSNYPEHFQGEKNIFCLPSYNEMDAVLFLPFWTQDTELYRDMCSILQEQCSVPVLCIGTQNPVFATMQPYTEAHLRAVLRHFMDEHGYTEIAYMTGPVGDVFAEQWLNACAAEQNTHHLPPRPETVFHGDWAGDAAQQLANRMLSGEIAMPRAMLFASDRMAIRFCDTIAGGGKEIPQTIAIGGYGGTTEALYHIPKIATFAPPLRAIGMEAVFRIYTQITGKTDVWTAETMAFAAGLYGNELETGTTCGCPEMTMAFPMERFHRRQTQERFAKAFRGSNMMISLEEATNLVEFCERLNEKNDLLGDAVDSALCLNTDWDEMSSAESYRRSGYTNQMLLLRPHCMPVQFERQLLLPPSSGRKDGATVSLFLPLHFNARAFGYAVMCFDAHPEQYCRTLSDWVECVCNGLELIRVRNHLMRVSSQLAFSVLRDPFTGLYEKQAIPQFFSQFRKGAEKLDGSLMALYVDLDQLSTINSQYGYPAGDQFILEVSKRLSAVLFNEQTCFRLDGGHFLILGAGNYHDADAKRWAARVELLAKEFQQTQDVPYPVGMTTGYACMPLKEVVQIETVIALAEDKCKRNKQQKKRLLTTPHYMEFLMLRRQIYKEPERKWNIEDMCRTVFLSRTYFQTVYHRLFGVSCKQDVTDSKMLCAKRLLRTTNNSISDIAEKCAYENVTSFLRRFKQCTGRSPDQFRKTKSHIQSDSTNCKVSRTFSD